MCSCGSKIALRNQSPGRFQIVVSDATADDSRKPGRRSFGLFSPRDLVSVDLEMPSSSLAVPVHVYHRIDSSERLRSFISITPTGVWLVRCFVGWDATEPEPSKPSDPGCSSATVAAEKRPVGAAHGDVA
jgi:hypothetical protein